MEVLISTARGTTGEGLWNSQGGKGAAGKEETLTRRVFPPYNGPFCPGGVKHRQGCSATHLR